VLRNTVIQGLDLNRAGTILSDDFLDICFHSVTKIIPNLGHFFILIIYYSYIFTSFMRALYTINLLKPTGFEHQQFNVQQLYALPTLYLFLLYLSQNKQRLVPLTA